MNYLLVFIFLLLPLAALGQSQQSEIDELKQDIELFTGVLEEALDLDQNSGLFGLSLGGVDPVYLQGQGLVLEVRSQLATRRNRLNLASLNSTMQSLRSGQNPFDVFRQRNAENANDSSASPRFDSVQPTETADSFYQQMMQRVAEVDYSLVINTAIQQASNSVRSLRSLGEVNETDYQQLRSELESLRSRLAEGLAAVQELEASAQEAGEEINNETGVDEVQLSAQLDELLARFEPLRDEALAKARELQARMEEAETEYAQQWRADITEFENRLYSALCDFAAPLRRLSDQETLAVILKGLGDETDNQASDKVHVITLAEVRACQQGDISAEQLQSRSIAYSY